MFVLLLQFSIFEFLTNYFRNSRVNDFFVATSNNSLLVPDGSEFWNTDTIRKILMDETYDGALIQHRTENIAYNIDKRRKIPKHEL